MRPNPRSWRDLLIYHFFLMLKKELWAFLRIINYSSKFSPATQEVFELLGRLTSVKAVWMWIRSYQNLCDKEKILIREDACIKFYYETRPLYLIMDTSRIALGADLLQIKDWMTSTRYITWQHHTETNYICQQKLIQSEKKIQKHQDRSIGNTT